jgi:hypothetical protein
MVGFFSQRPNFSARLAGKFCQELATLLSCLVWFLCQVPEDGRGASALLSGEGNETRHPGGAVQLTLLPHRPTLQPSRAPHLQGTASQDPPPAEDLIFCVMGIRLGWEYGLLLFLGFPVTHEQKAVLHLLVLDDGRLIRFFMKVPYTHG